MRTLALTFDSLDLCVIFLVFDLGKQKYIDTHSYHDHEHTQTMIFYDLLCPQINMFNGAFTNSVYVTGAGKSLCCQSYVVKHFC